ncbi:MAG: hypothetical protein NW237_15655 [Cyanobacteriota bacterium]|nr:hypothetical protein [Cyanobacteriota bacterium]
MQVDSPVSVWFEGDPTAFDSTDAAIAFGLAALKEPPKNLANPTNAQISNEVKNRFGLTLTEAELSANNAFVLASADFDHNGSTNSIDAAVAFAVAVLREPPNNIPDPTAKQVEAEVWQRFGIVVNLAQVPGSSPDSSPSPNPSMSPSVSPSPSSSPSPGTDIDDLFPDLPPDPGEEGKKTLAGIDADNDGVRDDVQRWIYERVPNEENLRKSLLKYAEIKQLSLLNAEDKQKSLELALRSLRSLECSWWHSQELGLGEDGIDLTMELAAQIVNTKQRVIAEVTADSHSSGGVVSKTPYDQRPALCEF